MSGYQPPPGPPPEKTGHRLFSSQPEYQAPSGPPPGHASSSGYQPPPGPPPGHSAPPDDEAPPPYHDWTIIPDTSLLPPPPGMTHDFSTGANATKYEAEQAKQWCYFNQLWQARQLSPDQLNAVHNRSHVLVKPPSFIGEIRQDGAGAWVCHTRSATKDSLIQTSLPAYSALADSPLVTERTKALYFEVKIIRFGEHAPKQKSSLFSRHRHEEEIDAGLAMGFFAPPYPTFRLPGWQRGSLGVHSDDGRRYVNDTDGGIDFTSPFKAGQTVGLGMTFKFPNNPPPAYGERALKLDVEVFFTRDGKKEGSWNLHEERDETAEPHGIEGLEGQHDLFPAVGVFGAVEWEIRFLEREWLYRPPR